MGSRRAARSAGPEPKNSPTEAEISTPRPAQNQLSEAGMLGMVARTTQATMPPHRMPIKPPASVSVIASSRNWTRISEARAPIALRTPIAVDGEHDRHLLDIRVVLAEVGQRQDGVVVDARSAEESFLVREDADDLVHAAVEDDVLTERIDAREQRVRDVCSQHDHRGGVFLVERRDEAA